MSISDVIGFMKDNWLFIVISIFIFMLISYLMKTYNEMVAKRNDIEQSSSGILIQLRKKVDLIPNLAKTVKRYSEHEKDTLTEIARLREGLKKELSKGKLDKSIASLDNQLTSMLHGLNVKVEAYPELKADKHYIKLLEELRDIEENIAAARRIYNSNVYDFNTYIETFPNNFVAAPFGFSRATFFETDNDIEEKAENIDIDNYV